jgi:hypothetical protein
MKCPEFSEILDFIENKLSPDSKKRLEKHLKSGCLKCNDQYGWALETIQLMKSSKMVEAPEYVVKKANSLFPERKKKLFDWVRAQLDFDSWSVPEIAGVRSKHLGPRQLSYGTENYKVILLLQSEKDSATLTGQLIPKMSTAKVEGCLVQLRSKSKIINSKFTNAAGEFILSPVPSKKFVLLIHGDPESIRISF